jgi:hypothetical protein
MNRSARLQGATNTIGYGRPPAEHRFKPGISGNPRGRPRKSALSTPPGIMSVSVLVLEEAYRPVTVRDNNKTETLPMIQVIFRKLAHSAAGGSHRSQMALTRMVQSAEQGKLDERQALFEAMVGYKAQWQKTFEQYDLGGEPRPDPVPHPDDLGICARTGEVIINGPFDDGEKATWDQYVARKAQALKEIVWLSKRSARKRLGEALCDRSIAQAKSLVDMVDRTFPSEGTRRRPDFDIREWRESQIKLQKLVEKLDREEKLRQPDG